MAAISQPDAYCLFWIQWWATCLSKDEWASWMQALGSLLALAIAIAMPVAMHLRERAERKKEEQATALIVALGIHANLAPLVGASKAVRDDMRAYAIGNGKPNIELAIRKFRTVSYPSEWQILQIARVDENAAVTLARGVAIAAQVHRSICFYEGKLIGDKARGHVAKLHNILDGAVVLLELAQSLLEPLMTPEASRAADEDAAIAKEVSNAAVEAA